MMSTMWAVERVEVAWGYGSILLNAPRCIHPCRLNPAVSRSESGAALAYRNRYSTGPNSPEPAQGYLSPSGLLGRVEEAGMGKVERDQTRKAGTYIAAGRDALHIPAPTDAAV